MDLFVLIIIFFSVVLNLFNIFANYQLKRLDKLIEQKVRDSIPTMFTEVDGNIIYLYEEKTNTFQCQASTIEELAKFLLEIKNTGLAKVIHNNKELWFVDGDVLDEIELQFSFYSE
jgi:hypothetical protein